MRVHYILPALLGATTARIVGLAAPSKLAPGSDFQITLITEDYVQSVFDVSAAFGLSPIVFPGTLGTYISSFYIGEARSNDLTNVTHSATIPESQPLGQTNLEAAVTSLYGASSGPVTTIWSLSITIANFSSAVVVSTFDGVNSCSAISPNASVSSVAPAAPATAVAAPAKPTHLNKLIRTVRKGLTTLINEILHNDLASAQTQYNSLSPSFDRIFHLANPTGSCPNQTTGHQLNQSQAIGVIERLQLTLSKLSLEVTNGNSTAALRHGCIVLADYFNGGLHEYVFGSDGSG